MAANTDTCYMNIWYKTPLCVSYVLVLAAPRTPTLTWYGPGRPPPCCQAQGKHSGDGRLLITTGVLAPYQIAKGEGPQGRPPPAAGRPMAAEAVVASPAHSAPGLQIGLLLGTPPPSQTPSGQNTPIPNSGRSGFKGEEWGLGYLRMAGTDDEGSQLG